MTAVERSELRHEHGATDLVVGAESRTVVDELGAWVRDRNVCVVTSEKLWHLHGSRALRPLQAAAAGWLRIEVADGEEAKSLATAETAWSRMLEAGIRRDSRVIAFGGGSIGDLAGFVAGTYMRGLDLVQLPTTLLAQVDAAVGGKTAVNCGGVKNSVGVFHHPAKVVSVTGYLSTLPDRQLRSGLVEVVKMASLLDLELLELVERDLDLLLAPEATAAAWVPIVIRAQRAKAGVVQRDPREAGERRVLNFGHTLGHAIEVAVGPERVTHGEAVDLGIRFALELASRRGLDGEFRGRIEALLDRLGSRPLPPVDSDTLLELLSHDKKAMRHGIVWVLPTGPGSWRAEVVDSAEIRGVLERFVARRRATC